MTDNSDKLVTPLVFGVIGFQDSGKTLLVDALVRQAHQEGYRVAVVKHDGHADKHVDGTQIHWEKEQSDTERAGQAGADWTMLASRSGWLLHAWEDETDGVDAWLDMLLYVSTKRGKRPDVIFVEGGKTSRLPKIAVLRSQAEWDELSSLAPHVMAACVSINAKLNQRLDVGPLPVFLWHQSVEIWRFLQQSCGNENLDKKF